MTTKNYIPLSPVDHLFTGCGAYPIQFLFTYPARLDREALENSLKETLEVFPPFRSQLEQVDEFSYGLVARDPGFHFEVSEGPVEEAKVDRVETLPGETLVKFHLTQDRAASALAVSISHCVADGYSFFYFLSSWAATFQGKAFAAPSHDRRALIPKKVDLPTEKITAEKLQVETGLFWADRRQEISEQKLKWKILPFSREELKHAAQECAKQTDIALSENDVLCAMLWKKMAEGRQGPYSLTCPLDYRRLHSKLSPFYIGNAVCVAGVELPAENLAKMTLTDVAITVRRGVRRIRAEEAERSLLYMEAFRRQEGLGAMESINLVSPRGGFLVTNMSRLPLAALDFGAGSPLSAKIVTPGVGIAAVLPSKNGIEVNLSEIA